MDPGRDRREAARRQGAQRPRRPARARPGAGGGAARPHRATYAAGCRESTGWSCRSTSPCSPACSRRGCRPRPASAGTAASTRRRRRTRWAGCSTRSAVKAPSPGCTPAPRRRRSRCCAAPAPAGSRSTSTRWAPPTTRCSPRRSTRGRPSCSAWSRRWSPATPPDDGAVTERVLRWLDMVGLDPATISPVPGGFANVWTGWLVVPVDAADAEDPAQRGRAPVLTSDSREEPCAPPGSPCPCSRPRCCWWGVAPRPTPAPGR